MNSFVKANRLLPPALGLGALGCGLRLLLERLAMDDRGLLSRNHPLTWGLWLVLLATVGLCALAVRNLDGSRRYEHNFSPSPLASWGCWVAGAGILVTVLGARTEDIPLTLWKILGYASCVCLAVWGWCRQRGKVVPTVAPLVLCLFFLAHLVAHYRSWSADPQTMDYLFDLLAAIGLMLFSYYCATFSAGMGARRMQLATGHFSVALCLMALSVTQWPWLCVGGLLFATTNLCALTPVPKEEPHEDS